MRSAIAVALAALWLGAGATMASASAPQGPDALFGIRPGLAGRTTLADGHFTYTVPAGSSVADSIVVTNDSQGALWMRVYAADMVPARGGGFAPAQAYQTMTGVGAWLSPRSVLIHLPPRQEQAVRFSLTVPSGMPPGDYLGAMVAATDLPDAQPGLSQEVRAALTVKVTVAGAVHAAALLSPLGSQPSSSGRVFQVTVRNLGNVLLTLHGQLTITDIAGHPVARLPLEPDGVYVIPGGSTNLSAAWPASPVAGVFDAAGSVTVSFGRHAFETLSTRPERLVFVPWGHLAGGLLILVVIGLGLRPARRMVAEYRAEQRDVREFKRQRRDARRR